MREVNFQSEGESESEEYSSRLSKSITLNTHSQFCFVAPCPPLVLIIQDHNLAREK